MTYKYNLSKSSKKELCPSCGKKSFTPYLYADTNEIVNATAYGRCDRENNCAAHFHPNDDKEFTPSHTLKEPPPPPEVIQIFPEEKLFNPIINRTRTATSPLHKYLNKTLQISIEHIIKWGVLSDNKDELKTVFLYQNRERKISNIKWFKYKENGHRDKEFNAYSLKQPRTPSHTPKKSLEENSKLNKDSATKIYIKKYLMCLFGEHLLSNDKAKTICLVESEKTAVIASFFYPQFDWLACGSSNGLGVSDGVPGDFKIKQLYGRKIFWIADADKAGRSNSSINLLQKYGQDYTVIDLFPDRNDGYDLADAIIDGVRPDITLEYALITTSNQFSQNGKEISAEESERLEGLMYKLPKGVEWKNVKESVINYRMFTHDKKIFIIKGNSRDDSYYSIPITNFSIESLGLIESIDNPRRLISVHNIHGIKKELELPTRAFASNTEFTVFIESEGNFQYNGAASDLKVIRSKLYDTMTAYKEIDTLGWNHGMLFFANGIYNGKFHKVDKYGFVQIKKDTDSYFIPALSAINKMAEEDWEDERKFIYVKKDTKMKDWAELFIKVHKENGVIALAYFITSLFRDCIYKYFKFFPHLFLFGPPGSGKSQVAWSIRAMGFATDKKPFFLSSGTKVAFHREFSHFVNFPAWFDEYDNSIDYERVQSLKAAYDGAGHKKSVKDSDKRTKTVPVNSACIISGQQLPIADVALFKRVILSQFNQTEYNKEERELHNQLTAVEKGGLSHITAALTNFRPLFENEYLKTFNEVFQDFIDTYNEDVEDRILKNMCVIATTIKLLKKELKESIPYTYEDFKKVAINFVKEQMSLINRANETNVFWDMVSYLFDQNYIKIKQDFKFTKELRVTVMVDRSSTAVREFKEPKDLLYVRTTNIFPLYKEHFKRQNSGNSSAMDKGSLLHYLQHQKYYVGFCKAVRFDTGRTNNEGKNITTPFSCYVFDYQLMEMLGINLKRGEDDGYSDGMPNEEPF